MSSTTYNLITKQLENLPEEMQKKVLKYVKNLQKDSLNIMPPAVKTFF